jgi:hypothetical protein
MKTIRDIEDFRALDPFFRIIEQASKVLSTEATSSTYSPRTSSSSSSSPCPTTRLSPSRDHRAKALTVLPPPISGCEPQSAPEPRLPHKRGTGREWNVSSSNLHDTQSACPIALAL